MGTADQQGEPATSVHTPAPCWTGELLLFSCQLALVQLGPPCLSPKPLCSSRAGSCTHPRARPSSPSPPPALHALHPRCETTSFPPSTHAVPLVFSSTPEPRVPWDTTEAALKIFVCSPSLHPHTAPLFSPVCWEGVGGGRGTRAEPTGREALPRSAASKPLQYGKAMVTSWENALKTLN